MLSAEITINAPPNLVREIMLDFPRIPQWHTTQPFFLGIEAPGKGSGMECKEGDKLTVKLSGMSFSPVVQENKPGHFKWLGSIPLLLSGPHDFFFRSVEGNPNATLFRQEENFSGLLGWIFDRPTSSGGQSTSAGWNRFNEDLKKEAEKVWSERQGGAPAAAGA